MLPDGKTIVEIDIGETEKDTMNDLVNVYLDSNMLDNPYKILKEHTMITENSKKKQRGDEMISTKSLGVMVAQTISNYCEEEVLDIGNIDAIVLTGGGMNLGSLDGLKLSS